jgi:hypothetical protein
MIDKFFENLKKDTHYDLQTQKNSMIVP